ncbi:MAG TPA: polysaccharide biosynthesis/export family protein [Ferruginibacter sp.]|nr:polysaccharide biosynthesis/export family protein [Ferruginibacter sp.]HMP19668.1 polysaccharide biosynthesis/export family protein [Ferruginibacter sp.]
MVIHFKSGRVLLLLVFCALCLPACINTKKVVYVNNIDAALLNSADSASLSAAQYVFEAKIQKNDQLWITVGGSNAEDMQVLNSGSGIISGGIGAIAGGGSNSILGYFVEADGSIKVPYVGKIQVEGLTRVELETKLAELYSAYTKNPVVNVRFLNHGFSVLGEVNRAGRFSMQNERVTILDAISMAGDLSTLGRRENVLLIRETEGKRVFTRLNLLSKDLFTSPYFYLKTNDVIYVEPVGAKFINRSGVPQYIAIAAAGLALILTIINISKK